jgi:hypothetical protein
MACLQGRLAPRACRRRFNSALILLNNDFWSGDGDDSRKGGPAGPAHLQTILVETATTGAAKPKKKPPAFFVRGGFLVCWQ